MVAQDGEDAVGSLEHGQVVAIGNGLARHLVDQVAREDHQVGLLLVGRLDDAAHKGVVSTERAEMEVGEVEKAIAVEGGGKSRETDPHLSHLQSAPAQRQSVDGQELGRDGGEKTRPGCDNLEEKEADLGHDEAEDAAVERARGKTVAKLKHQGQPGCGQQGGGEKPQNAHEQRHLSEVEAPYRYVGEQGGEKYDDQKPFHIVFSFLVYRGCLRYSF